MKTALLITLFLIPFLGSSQTLKPIDGFIGIKFGSSKAQVMEAMKTKGVYEEKYAKENELAFTGVKLGQRSTEYMIIKFIDDKAYMGAFAIKPEDQPQTLDYYKALESDLNDIYGPGKLYTDFKSPFAYGDGNEILAIQNGSALIYTKWMSGQNMLVIRTSHKGDTLFLQLLYTDTTLEAEVTKREKAKSDL